MTGDLAIIAEGIGKTYRMYPSQGSRLADLLRPAPRRGSAFSALDSIDLKVRRGESVGVIGRNGAGKSTLLQVIAGMLRPSTGRVTVNGRVAALLELGAGFDPDFSGRENVAMAAAILGLSDTQIVERFEAILAFAGIGAAIDRPVREYSSGMYARLAFAVAVHVDADILIIDEILAVGDAAFQRQCHRAIEAFLSRGGTLLFVSHDEGAVLEHCARAIWLEHGRLVADGPSRSICRQYAEALHRSDAESARSQQSETRHEPMLILASGPAFHDPRWQGTNPIIVTQPDQGTVWHGEGGGEIEHIALIGRDGTPLSATHGGDEVELRISCRARRALNRPIVGYILRNANGENLAGDNTYLRTRESGFPVAAGEQFVARFILQLPYLPAGDHFFAPSIIEGTQRDHIHLHWIENALCLRAIASPVTLGAVGVPARNVSFGPVVG